MESILGLLSMIVLIIVLLLVAKGASSLGKSIVRKVVKECVTSLDTYINNLEFEPTAIYATVLCIPHQKDVSMFSEKAIKTFSCAKTLADEHKNLIQNNYQKLPPVNKLSREMNTATFKPELPNVNSFFYPQLGVFLNSDKKLFAVRSKADEINPKVYKFSQLQDFAISEDVRNSMRGAVIIPYTPLIIGFGGKPLGKLSMRVIFSGTSGPESVTLEPEPNLLGEKALRERISTNAPIYILRCEELMKIAECLQWIKNNA